MKKSKNLSPDSFLDPENMIKLYALGAFPMAEDKDSEIINWYMPEVRTIIPLDNFNLPRSLRTFMKRNEYTVTFDTQFEKVIMSCRDRDESWISPKLVDSYKELFKMGYLHSVEIWINEKLVGGLYGISFKGAFFGESMFSNAPQASKIALTELVKHLNEKEFLLLDVQYQTDHLEMFGATQISIEEYNQILRRAHRQEVTF
ncbi:MAG: leucyl/phenylalanyl-tRNA--protein transferase [Ignavibacteria bacterium]|nr:leucyl/phenylalanyl-tRNA--protein transferase [Ignavibacteria bacterium]